MSPAGASGWQPLIISAALLCLGLMHHAAAWTEAGNIMQTCFGSNLSRADRLRGFSRADCFLVRGGHSAKCLPSFSIAVGAPSQRAWGGGGPKPLKRTISHLQAY